MLALAALLALVGGATAGGHATAAGPPGGEPPGLAKARAAKAKHEDKILDTPGVAGIGVGVNRAGKAVVKVYKERPDADVPATLDGVEVDSVTTGIIEARSAPTDRFPRPVPIGVSAGLHDFGSGTLGARVADGTHVFALSNNHVFAGINSASVGEAITQPGSADGGTDPVDRIGTLYAYQTINFSAGSTNTIDAAIALVSTANVGTTTPDDGYGTPGTVTAHAFVGEPVQKYGRTTGLQLGAVAGTDVSVDVCYLLLFTTCLQQARFVNQISVTPGTFSAAGDSGSLIVTQNGNQPVALLFAGGDGLTIGNPIDTVLQRFGVTIEGAPPSDGPPGSPSSVSATAGDAQVALSWRAPAFDGGSAITNYKVYRGTTPGAGSFLADAGRNLTYVDTSVVNGTTFYYTITAENTSGEGTPSNEVSSTPAAAAPPSQPLPVTDSFDRPNETLSDQGRWSNGIAGSVETGLRVATNQLSCSKTTTCTAWRNPAPVGPDTEVWSRLAALPGTGNQFRLYARVQQPGTAGFDGYMLRTLQQTGTDELYLERVDNGTITRLLTISQELTAGDTLLLRVNGSTVEAWRHDGTTWTRLGTAQDTTYPTAGRVGVGIRGTTGRLDDYGTRTLGTPPPDTTPPNAPGALQASSAGPDAIGLSWQAATDDTAVARYRIERCQDAGCATFSEIATTTQPGYSDTGLTPATSYSYRVRAEDTATNLGAYSNTASATTPPPNTPPAEPLPVTDSFDRPNETLSDQGRWSNGIAGSVETGLRVATNQLSCSKTTTCTAWRNPAPVGPDTEVWSRLAALPGTGNQFRLYARVQQPGTAGFDGYMLRTLQQTGTDELYLERVDNGTITRLLTISQELTAGDTLLLRVNGSTVEAWRHDGTTWTRLGTAQDTTYPTAGRVGVGIRGTTGRLDDYGTRTLGTPPPDTTPPNAPGALQASSAGPDAIGLSWQAATDDTAVARYRIERCQDAGCATFSEIATTTQPGYSDTGLTPATSYSYRVRAEDTATNLGAYSNTASATTPPPNTPPAEPLPVTDSFDRPNETLSDQGRWSNGIAGSVETGLRVATNQLSCSKTTTCTAWRNPAPVGPDTEVWSRLAALPGTGNQFRLYARVQQPGTAGFDGYMLRTLQQTGTDELYLERVDNGTITRLLTISQELTAGDTLLLRVNGSTVEAWRHDGTTWTRLGTAQDTTYPTAGRVGVGIRGTTGRLDDYGTR